jgi:hypothetical protein
MKFIFGYKTADLFFALSFLLRILRKSQVFKRDKISEMPFYYKRKVKGYKRVTQSKIGNLIKN